MSQDLHQKLLKLQSELESIDLSAANPVDRSLALGVASKIYQRLELPWDAIARMTWVEPATLFSTKIAIDMRLFEKLNGLGTASTNASDLAVAIGSEPVLTKRILRCLSSVGFVEEVDEDQYRGNDFSKTAITDEAVATLTWLAEVQSAHYRRLPDYVRDSGFKASTDPKNCAWQYTMNTSDSFFEWLGKNPIRVGQFGSMMRGFASSKLPWTAYFPTEVILAEGNDSTTDFLVDVGGGVGYDLMHLLNKHPDLAGRLTLQDTAEMLQKAVVDKEKIKVLAYDFFTPQPIKGARIYFLHSILHDWPDDRANKILLQLRPAMRKGYSKILLNESAVKVKDPTPASTGVDLLMMSLAGALERDERAWRSLLASAGMELVRVWQSPMGGQGIIEVELSESD